MPVHLDVVYFLPAEKEHTALYTNEDMYEICVGLCISQAYKPLFDVVALVTQMQQPML
jgi:hypothetical protein